MCQDYHDPREWEAEIKLISWAKIIERLCDYYSTPETVRIVGAENLAAEEFGIDVDDIHGGMKSDTGKARKRKRKTIKGMKAKRKGKRKKK